MADDAMPQVHYSADAAPPPSHKKPVNIVLTYNQLLRTYKVTSISNSVYYKPGDILTIEVVKVIIEKTDWEVVASDDEFIKHLIQKIPLPIPL